MTMGPAEKVQHELRRLPEPLIQEVLDFIVDLECRHGLKDPDVLSNRRSVESMAEQAIAAFRGSGKGGGTERLLAEHQNDLGREACQDPEDCIPISQKNPVFFPATFSTPERAKHVPNFFWEYAGCRPVHSSGEQFR
ncbi:MAG: hypothetical protein HW380_3361 [Magnetococcales bacterium]|nr:hypothetical protein [Magnetococcales bacterium]